MVVIFPIEGVSIETEPFPSRSGASRGLIPLEIVGAGIILGHAPSEDRVVVQTEFSIEGLQKSIIF